VDKNKLYKFYYHKKNYHRVNIRQYDIFLTIT